MTALASLLDPEHPLLRMARTIDWQDPVWPELCTAANRRMLGLTLLQIVRGLSDRELWQQWLENPYFQLFCGESRFHHQLETGPEDLAVWRAEINQGALQSWLAAILPSHPEPPATFVIDVDGVVAKLTPENNYSLAEPIVEVINAINRLYDRGHRIVMLTARGSATGRSWTQLTADQFSRWGLRYHELHFGKPAADYYVDDRMITVDMLCAMAAGRTFPPSSMAPHIGKKLLSGDNYV